MHGVILLFSTITDCIVEVAAMLPIIFIIVTFLRT